MITIIWIVAILFAILIGTVFTVTMLIKIDNSHTVSETSWHVRLFKILTTFDNGSEWLPKTICSYFWKYVIAIMTMPLILPSIIINLFLKSKMGRALGILISVVGYVLIAGSIGIGINAFEIKSLWLAFLVGLLTIAVIAALTTGLAYLLEYIFKKSSKNINRKPLIVSRFKSWKEKNCPIIKYED